MVELGFLSRFKKDKEKRRGFPLAIQFLREKNIGGFISSLPPKRSVGSSWERGEKKILLKRKNERERRILMYIIFYFLVRFV